ncbi:MAG: ferredoxin III, nif-specific [Phormidium sp.]
MAVLTATTFGGKTWTPQFLQDIKIATCLGCGRCFKACGRGVMELKSINEHGEFIEDEDEEESLRKVMTVANAENCIGCEACSRVCPKNCHIHTPLDLN